MADVFTKVMRSEVMSLIRSSGNRETELVMVALFRELGITGWRRGQRLRLAEKLKAEKLKAEKGQAKIIRPDFLFRQEKIAVFVDGDFWHGHPIRAKIPATRREWWLAKIEGNKKRDRMQNRLLRANGWTVVRIWQHELTPKHRAKGIRKLRRAGLNA
jgi:DNA mismatch endonuclease, patch repair protein